MESEITDANKSFPFKTYGDVNEMEENQNEYRKMLGQMPMPRDEAVVRLNKYIKTRRKDNLAKWQAIKPEYEERASKDYTTKHPTKQENSKSRQQYIENQLSMQYYMYNIETENELRNDIKRAMKHYILRSKGKPYNTNLRPDFDEIFYPERVSNFTDAGKTPRYSQVPAALLQLRRTSKTSLSKTSKTQRSNAPNAPSKTSVQGSRTGRNLPRQPRRLIYSSEGSSPADSDVDSSNRSYPPGYCLCNRSSASSTGINRVYHGQRRCDDLIIEIIKPHKPCINKPRKAKGPYDPRSPHDVSNLVDNGDGVDGEGCQCSCIQTQTSISMLIPPDGRTPDKNATKLGPKRQTRPSNKCSGKSSRSSTHHRSQQYGRRFDLIGDIDDLIRMQRHAFYIGWNRAWATFNNGPPSQQPEGV